MRAVLPLSLFLLSIGAYASTVLGNPQGNIVAVVGDDLYVDRLAASYCEGGVTTVTLEVTLDEDDEVGVQLPQDDYCSLELAVRWTPSGPLERVDVTGFTVFQVTSTADKFAIELDATTEEAVLVIP